MLSSQPEQPILMITRATLIMVLPMLLGGCLGRLTEPQCVTTPFSQASLSGDTVTTTTGLRYIDGDAGAGAAAEWCQDVAIHYEASLLDGTQFDSSRDRGGLLVFAPGLSGLIGGLEQGVVGMRAGGTRRLIIPPELGFGTSVVRNQFGEIVVPANSTVIYDVELVQLIQ
jgi:FKBP-type peptidyl-prolyl cis-trans isomerase